jgi:hypothetical protein
MISLAGCSRMFTRDFDKLTNDASAPSEPKQEDFESAQADTENLPASPGLFRELPQQNEKPGSSDLSATSTDDPKIEKQPAIDTTDSKLKNSAGQGTTTANQSSAKILGPGSTSLQPIDVETARRSDSIPRVVPTSPPRADSEAGRPIHESEDRPAPQPAAGVSKSRGIVLKVKSEAADTPKPIEQLATPLRSALPIPPFATHPNTILYSASVPVVPSEPLPNQVMTRGPQVPDEPPNNDIAVKPTATAPSISQAEFIPNSSNDFEVKSTRLESVDSNPNSKSMAKANEDLRLDDRATELLGDKAIEADTTTVDDGPKGFGDFEPNREAAETERETQRDGKRDFAALAGNTRPSKTVREPLPWDLQLDSTIDAFENQIGRLSETDQKASLNSGLAILRTLRNKLTDEDQAQFFQSADHRKFWDHQVDAISVLLKQSEEDFASGDQAKEALKHLQQAVRQLKKIADLRIASAAFCSRVTGFGQFTPMNSLQFRSGQQTLVYCEIENFLPMTETANELTTYRTRIRSSVSITNKLGKIVQKADFPVVEDVARNFRQDFYMHLPVTIATLPEGNYSLQVTVDDLGSGKTAKLDRPLRFSVR